MAQFDVDFINNRLSLADGDEIRLTSSNPAYFVISALTADVTVSIKTIAGGSYRDFTEVVPNGQSKSTVLLPVGVELQFTGSAVEVWAYGA